MIPTPGLCFDIGAHHGDKSRVFSKIDLDVIAIEPQSSCIPVLKAALKPFPRAAVLQLAVAQKPGRIKLMLCNHTEVSTASHEFRNQYERYEYLTWSDSEWVEATTLDELIVRYGKPVFCKIDIEGYELHALSGLSEAINLIEFEYNILLKDNAVKCVERLARLGQYRFNFSAFENFELMLDEFLSTDDFIDFLAALPGDVLTGDIYCRLEEIHVP
ncbi:MAG: hypothetical protein Kow0075_16720 [Salibacteraceae bacterium]